MLKPGFEKQINLEECRRSEERESPAHKIRVKIRFDYQGRARPSRFFFGKKSTEEAATELRQQQSALWRNVPVQGILIEDLEMGEIYFVFDDEVGAEVAYAPLELEVWADSLCYLVRFAVREEFRRLRIMEPTQISLSMQDMEQVFFEVHDQAKTQVMLKARKYQD